MNIKKIGLVSAIIGAVVYVFYSILNLIAFAINQNAIQPDVNSIVFFVVNNFNFLFYFILILLLVTNIFIYSGFISWSKQKKQKTSLIFSSIFLTFVCLNLISIMFSFGNNLFRIIFAISYILFGIVLLLVKQNRKTILLALSTIYIVQGIFILLSFVTFSQVVELTVGIKILEAVFFKFNK